MKTTIAPKAINSSAKGVTMLMEANQEHGTTFVPRLLKWDEILSNNDWKFESITEPLPIQPSRSSLESITQFSDGSINLMFLISNSFNQASSSRRTSSVRPSSSKNQEDDEVSEVSKALERSKFQGVDFTNTIPKVFMNQLKEVLPVT